MKKTIVNKFNSMSCRTCFGILLLVILLFAIIFPGSSSASVLKFVQVSDVHYFTGGTSTSYKLTGNSPELLDDAVEQINNMKDISFVMFTGDLTDRPEESELRSFLSHADRLTYPWYFTFGNHDTGENLSKNTFMADVAEHNTDFKFTNTYYTFTPHRGFKVIALDSVINKITSKGFIDKTQLEWLDEQIKTAPDDVILVFLHHPVMEPFSSSNHRLTNANEVDAILHKYKNPTAVFTGHYHACKIFRKDNVLYINSPSMVTYPNAFRVIKITNHRSKTVFDIKLQETGLKNLQKSSKMLLPGASLHNGEEKDKNVILEINKKD